MRNKRRKRTGSCILWILIGLTLVYCVTDYDFRRKNRQKYADTVAFYEQCLEREQAWIAAQQHPRGALYLYEPEPDVPGAVNPYFACLSLRGLLVGQPGKNELETVEKYLKWHTRELIQAEGRICDYQVVDMQVVETEKYDSVDSYIAVYLSLVAEYAGKGGNPDKIPDLEKAVEICVKRLQELTEEGLTCVSDTNSTCYLMDNAEVLEASRKMDRLLSDCEETKDWKHKEELRSYFRQAASQTEAAMKIFWSEQEKHFETGLNGDGTYLIFQGMERFYPEAIVQIYPVAFDIFLKKEETIRELYDEVSRLHVWNDSTAEDGLGWPVLSYIAVQLGDTESAEKYIEEYYKNYEQDRSYPLNTFDAGWVVRTCEALREYYVELAEQSLLDVLAKKIK